MKYSVTWWITPDCFSSQDDEVSGHGSVSESESAASSSEEEEDQRQNGDAKVTSTRHHTSSSSSEAGSEASDLVVSFNAHISVILSLALVVFTNCVIIQSVSKHVIF